MGGWFAPDALPDLFLFDDGESVLGPVDWPRCRAQIWNVIVPLGYGGLPALPDGLRFELLHRARVGRRAGRYSSPIGSW